MAMKQRWWSVNPDETLPAQSQSDQIANGTALRYTREKKEENKQAEWISALMT